MKIIIHEIAVDGFPKMKKLTGRVAFLWDGCIISGWPIKEEYDCVRLWEGSEDRFHGPFAGVTHWVEFPKAFWEIERGK